MLSRAEPNNQGNNMTKATRFLYGLALILASINAGHAAIIWDQSPAGIGGAATPPSGFCCYQNVATGQNFADRVSFTTAQTVTGMDIYTDLSHAAAVVGAGAVIRIRTPLFNTPPIEFNETINIKDTEGVGGAPATTRRLHVDFTLPVLLLPSTTYFFGMSGDGIDLGQLTLAGGFGPLIDNVTHQYGGTVAAGDLGGADMAFRLHSSPIAAIPEPSTYALMLAGLGLVGWAARRRRAGPHAKCGGFPALPAGA